MAFHASTFLSPLRPASRRIIWLLSLLLILAPARAETPAWRNPDLPFEQRADDLLRSMTLEEKIGQMMSDAPAIPRLGIPAYNWWSECLHGVAWAGEATVFPQAIGLGATFNPDLMKSIGDVISDEARVKHHAWANAHGGDAQRFMGLTFWSPNINMFRDPRWGRGQETYGEDPFLTGRLAVQFIRGLQGNDPHYLKLVATVKHYAVHSGPEPIRNQFNAVVFPWEMYDYFLPAFETSVREGHVESVMNAYNRTNWVPCSAHYELVESILRDRWHFCGYVVSDCGSIDNLWMPGYHLTVKDAAEASALAVRYGTDLNCGDTYKALGESVRRKFIDEPTIDRSLRRLMLARLRLGMFDPPERVAWTKIPASVLCSPEHRAVALRAARESIVLLKNDGLLPLKKLPRSIAVMGPNADSLASLVGNYHGTPRNPVTVLTGLRQRWGDRAKITYYPICDYTTRTVQPTRLITSDSLGGANGPLFHREVFTNTKLEGQPAETGSDQSVDYEWEKDHAFAGVPRTDFSVRWSGELIAPQSGTYHFIVMADDGFRLYVDDKLLIDEWKEGHTRTVKSPGIALKRGNSSRIRLEYFQLKGRSHIQLSWSLPVDQEEYARALKAAKKSDLVIFVSGITGDLEGESMEVNLPGFQGGDRTSIELPEAQESVLREVHATGVPIVLVNLSGSAMALPWEDKNIPAILQAWYPGESGGLAVADVLDGTYNPTGRLPVTFYASTQQLPDFQDYHLSGRTYRYMSEKPLYPFGYGLSYTAWAYSDLNVSRQDDHWVVRGTLTNTGKRAGTETAQVYLQPTHPSGLASNLRLCGFQKLTLEPGAAQSIEFTLTDRDFSEYSPNHNDYRLVPGSYLLRFGASSADPNAQTATLEINPSAP